MKLSELASHNIGSLVGTDQEFSAISIDTRTMNKGDLFVAIQGESHDAHDHIDEAIKNGCCGAVVAKLQDRQIPQLHVEDTVRALGKISQLYRKAFTGRVIAVTGSSGKTTVKGMLHHILERLSSCIATEGNFNNHIGVPLTLLRLKSSADYAVVEAGTSNPGEIAYLTELIEPDVALVVNVMPAHIENFGSLEAIAGEKSKIYAFGADERASVVNLDDSNLDILLDSVKSRRVIGFTTKNSVDSRYDNIPVLVTKDYQVNELGAVRFTAQIQDDIESFELNVIGPHHLQNALAAIACTWALGVSLTQAKVGLENFSGTPGRMHLIKANPNISIVDDSYNANPGSMKAAVDYLSNFANSVLVAGDMGELGRDAEILHREVGVYAKKKGVRLILTVGELSKNISEAFGEGAEHFHDKDSLLQKFDLIEKDKIMVLVKGSRSARMETVVKALSERWGAK